MNGMTTKTETGYRIAARTAAMAAVFSAIVCALLLYDFYRRTMKDPFEAKALVSLKKAVELHPADEDLLAACRAMDERVRAEYFRQLAFAAVGASLLCGGLVVMLAAAKSAATLRRTLPAPQPLAAPVDLESRWKPQAIAAVAAVALALAGLDVAVCAWWPGWLPTDEELAQPTVSIEPKAPVGPVATPATASIYVATDEEIRTAWSRFRGPDGSGISPYTNLPETWDVPANKNVLWKTPVPLPGYNSPIVCGKRVFLSGATASRRQVFCFNAVTGQLLWQQNAPSAPASAKPATPQGAADEASSTPAPEAPESEREYRPPARADFASSTLATDGRRVFAIFANGDLAAFDYGGNVVWSKSLGVPDSMYGHAASLLVYKDMLLVPLDQGGEAKAGRSKLLALDAATGAPVWQKTRPVRASWTTPIVIHTAGGDQLVTSSEPWVIAYDPKDGSELWRAKGLKFDVAPSPVFAGGLVLAAANEQSPLLAIRPDGKGDVSRSHVLWKAADNMPDLCSPVATDAAVYLLSSNGLVTGYDTRTGDMLWELNLGKFHAMSSPSLVGNRLYLIADNGKGLVLEPGKSACKKLGTTDLGEPCATSPAFQSGRIYLRGKKNLFCIGK
jgi:outer membrane protein assembly factor BamB